MISEISVGKRRKSQAGSQRTVHPLVESLTSEIIKAAEAKELTRDELGKRARGSEGAASTLYGWRNGNRKSPSVVELADFARAVGLRLTVVDATVPQAGPCGRPHVSSEFERQLLASVRALSEPADQKELLTLVADFVLSRTSGSRPPEPAGEQGRNSL
jgi:hypothetical protein